MNELPVMSDEEIREIFYSESLSPMLSILGDSAVGDPESKTGVLIIHGFSGSNIENMYLANYLARRGIRVFVPLLPGHGTDYKDLRKYSDVDWMDKVSQSLHLLIEERNDRRIFVAGHSMGGSLATQLCLQFPDVQGLILMASPMVFPRRLRVAMSLLRYLPLSMYFAGFKFHDRSLLDSPIVKYFDQRYERVYYKSIDDAFRVMSQGFSSLPALKVPVKMIYGTSDYRVPREQAEVIYERIGSSSKELVWIEETDHVIVIDTSREQVAHEILKFVSDMDDGDRR